MLYDLGFRLAWVRDSLWLCSDHQHAVGAFDDPRDPLLPAAFSMPLPYNQRPSERAILIVADTLLIPLRAFIKPVYVKS
jgi:hypothetical protein